MSLAGAKRRYKILLREQDRLRERSATDQEIDRELERLRADYPELQEVKSSLSSATASMLAFAESMVEPEGGAAAASTPLMSGAQLHTSQHVVNDESCTKPAAAVASDLLPEPNVAPPAEVGNKRASSSLKSSRSDETTAATADDAGAHKALQLLTTFMLWVAPFVAPSRTTRGLCLLVMLSSIAIPVVHRTEPSIAAPCNSVRYYSLSSSSSPTSSSSHTALRHAYGVVFDPIAMTMIVHVIYFIVVCRGTNVGAYIVKDLTPAMITSFVLYSATNMVLNMATELRPVRTFC